MLNIHLITDPWPISGICAVGYNVSCIYVPWDRADAGFVMEYKFFAQTACDYRPQPYLLRYA